MENMASNRLDTKTILKKRPVRFSIPDDIILLKEVLSINPFELGVRSLKSKQKWDEVAMNMRAHHHLEVDTRRCRERTHLLLDQHKTRDCYQRSCLPGSDDDRAVREELLEKLSEMHDIREKEQFECIGLNPMLNDQQKTYGKYMKVKIRRWEPSILSDTENTGECVDLNDDRAAVIKETLSDSDSLTQDTQRDADAELSIENYTDFDDRVAKRRCIDVASAFDVEMRMREKELQLRREELAFQRENLQVERERLELERQKQTTDRLRVEHDHNERVLMMQLIKNFLEKQNAESTH